MGRSSFLLSPGANRPVRIPGPAPAGCCSPAGRCSSSTTPVATPVPGFETTIVITVCSPIKTFSGADISRASFGRVAMVRAVASAPKWTVATLPISPSAMGIICISTADSSPGRSVPMVQRISPCGPCDARGVVPSNFVPLGTWSRISTCAAGIGPVLRTAILNTAGLPTWISLGANF